MLRSTFLALSKNKAFREFSERSPMGRKIASRFVAGTVLEEALEATARLNAEGLDVSLDLLGESVIHVSQAEETAAVYGRLLEEIAARGLRANISVKLSAVGMDIGGHGAGPALAEHVVGRLVEQAERLGNFVRIDMESSEYTEETLRITERLAERFPGRVGTVLQAYLRRTADDAERLLGKHIRIRLCKGAYKEGADVAFPAKSEVDAHYGSLMKRMVTSGTFCGIATHDEALIDQLKRFAVESSLDRNAFEFQMLYGVRRDLQRSLRADGYRVRVYLPFGKEWFPYFMRRLAERPANVLFVAKNFFRQ